MRQVHQAKGVYAFNAHLQKGSIVVEVGQRVLACAVVGRLGNSTAPHLHFGPVERPDFLTGYSRPWSSPETWR